MPGERIADVAGNDARTALGVYRRRLRDVADAAVQPMEAFLGALVDTARAPQETPAEVS